jgi:hypothetical protein
MTQDDNNAFDRNWKEFWGRRKIIEPIPFTETSILTQPATIRVGGSGHFLQLPANTAGIITSSTGNKQVFTEGGYFKLEEGAYTIQYVDLSERFITLPKIAAATKDGSNVSLTISIGYKVNDPTQIIGVTTPLQTLFSVCEAATKNFIVTHRHDELIGEPGKEQYIADNEIIQDLKEQVAMNQACRAFWVMNVIIKERYGNLEISKIKHDSLVQEKKNITERQNIIQQQGIAEEQKLLEKTKAEQKSMVTEMQALTDANKSEILKHARYLEIELENLRKQPDYQQEQIIKMIEVKKQALETLSHLYTISGFPRDTNDLKLIEKILGSLSETHIVTPELPPERSKSVNDLSSTIINLIAPKKKE